MKRRGRSGRGRRLRAAASKISAGAPCAASLAMDSAQTTACPTRSARQDIGETHIAVLSGRAGFCGGAGNGAGPVGFGRARDGGDWPGGPRRLSPPVF